MTKKLYTASEAIALLKGKGEVCMHLGGAWDWWNLVLDEHHGVTNLKHSYEVAQQISESAEYSDYAVREDRGRYPLE